MNFVLSLALVVFGASSAWAAKDCSDSATWEHLKPKKTAAECHAMIEAVVKSCDPETTNTDNAMVAQLGYEAYCDEQALNTELDKRLVPLKKSNAAEFKKEMGVQADYKKMIDGLCVALNSCDGTMYRITGTTCHLTVTQWRLKQAQDLNAKKLMLAENKEKSKFSAPSLKAFAKSFCSMSDEVFGGKHPADCELRVTGEVMKAAGGNCHDEDDENGN